MGFEQWTKPLWLAVNQHTLAALSQHKNSDYHRSNDALFRSVTTSWSVLIFITCDLPWHSPNAFVGFLFGVAWIPHDHSNCILTEQTFSLIVWIRKIWSFYCLTGYLAVTSPLKVVSERLPVTLILTTKLFYGIPSKKRAIFMWIFSIPHSFLVSKR
jgi:hypothetical protein